MPYFCHPIPQPFCLYEIFSLRRSFTKRVIIIEAYVDLMKIKMRAQKESLMKIIEENERFTRKAERSRKIQAMMNYLLFLAFIIYLEIGECLKQKKKQNNERKKKNGIFVALHSEEASRLIYFVKV